MLYYLFEKLKDFDIPGQGLMNYLSFGAIAANVIAMLMALFFGKKVIAWLQRKQIGETIRDLGLEGQMAKKGTPTMGGIIILVALLTAVLLLCDLGNIYIQLLLLTTVWCGALGFADDYIKVFKHNKNGLSEGRKLAGQFLLGVIVAATVCFSPKIVVREQVTQASADEQTEVVEGQTVQEDVIKSTKTTIPFVKNHEFDYKYLSPFKGTLGWYCKWAIYALVIIFILLACSNGANLTDGMDGLSAGTSAIVAVVLGILAWLGGNVLNASYLNIMYIPASGEIAVFLSANAPLFAYLISHLRRLHATEVSHSDHSNLVRRLAGEEHQRVFHFLHLLRCENAGKVVDQARRIGHIGHLSHCCGCSNHEHRSHDHTLSRCKIFHRSVH